MLKTLVNGRQEGRYDGDGKFLGYVDHWLPPTHAISLAKQSARTALMQIPGPPSPDTIRDFLVLLGTLVAKNMTVAEAKAKMAAYAQGLTAYPASCFTKEAAFQVAGKCEWFPNWHDLTKALDEIAAPEREIRYRLEKVLAATTREPGEAQPGKRWGDLTDAEKAQHEAVMTQLQAIFPSKREAAGKPTLRNVTLRNGPGSGKADAA